MLPSINLTTTTTDLEIFVFGFDLILFCDAFLYLKTATLLLFCNTRCIYRSLSCRFLRRLNLDELAVLNMAMEGTDAEGTNADFDSLVVCNDNDPVVDLGVPTDLMFSLSYFTICSRF
jgi:hypothetical protein